MRSFLAVDYIAAREDDYVRRTEAWLGPLTPRQRQNARAVGRWNLLREIDEDRDEVIRRIALDMGDEAAHVAHAIETAYVDLQDPGLRKLEEDEGLAE